MKMPAYRIGHGFDLHCLEPGRKLIIAGRQIDSPFGCVAHSDGDVVCHAVTDALLGALGQEDIGQLFRDDDPRWQNADSSVFMEEAVRRVASEGYAIANVDVTVILQKPRIDTHKMVMRQNLARGLGCEPSVVNLKGKTHEHVGAVGRSQAIVCHAVVLLEAT